MIVSKQSRTDKGSEDGQIPSHIFHRKTPRTWWGYQAAEVTKPLPILILSI